MSDRPEIPTELLQPVLKDGKSIVESMDARALLDLSDVLQKTIAQEDRRISDAEMLAMVTGTTGIMVQTEIMQVIAAHKSFQLALEREVKRVRGLLSERMH